jgi:predicted component of type VI protein secretion system
LLVLALFGAAATFVVPARWGCPSQAELERARASQEVVGAFADRGVELVRAQLPRAVPRDRAYRHAVAYRHLTARAALFVLVCEARCTNAPRLRELDIPVVGQARQHVRLLSTLGNNIAIFVTDNNGYSGRQLLASVGPIVNGLDAHVDSDSRCSIG